MNRALKATAMTLLTVLVSCVSLAQDSDSKLTLEMGITQKLGAWVPQDAKFKDESGKDVTFKDLIVDRPIVLVPLFYSCKTMCVNLTDGLATTISKGTKYDELRPGRDFDVVMLSINPKETPDLAQAKKAEIFNMMTPPKNGGEDVEWRTGAEKGWHMLTGSYDEILKVTNAIGFKYKYDAKLDLINHPAASMILTKNGRVSSYIIGPSFPTKVLQTDLELAQKNEVGVKADQSFMFGCIMLDPSTGRYTIAVEKVLQLACVLTVLAIAAWITSMSLRERRDRKNGGLAQAGKAL